MRYLSLILLTLFALQVVAEGNYSDLHRPVSGIDPSMYQQQMPTNPGYSTTYSPNSANQPSLQDDILRFEQQRREAMQQRELSQQRDISQQLDQLPNSNYSTQSYNQQPASSNQYAPPAQSNSRNGPFAGVKFTPEQLQQIDQIMERERLAHEQRITVMQQAQKELQALYMQDIWDVEAITRNYGTIFQNQQMTITAMAQAHNDIYALLNEEQKKEMSEMTEQQLRVMERLRALGMQ